jgi:catalase (peroxidase I)
MVRSIELIVALMALPSVASMCPFLGREASHKEKRPAHHPPVPTKVEEYRKAAAEIDFDAVKADLFELYTSSQDDWPADYGNYAPFFIRLAWHSNGSYRTSDGRGGCDGARQRFDPERSWADNTNLDKARNLLLPIKEKYGLGLSWGDLFTFAGTSGIEFMGGPVLGFCGGRIDDENGDASTMLGPTDQQNALYPCAVDGDCEAPLGATTLGLIYVNPEGPMGNPDPVGSVIDVRDTFGRMAMNDSETVALIGGGHCYGKTHGACPDGAGPSPMEDPENPWPGNCGTGKGPDAFTTGFEGPWTTNPTSWDNEFFNNLLNYNYTAGLSVGGHYQWTAENPPQAPDAFNENATQSTMMLTSDMSLINDPDYLALVQQYASDLDAFDDAFKHAWYKLTTRDMGPATRCIGNDVPPPQAFQYPLPDPPSEIANISAVADAVREALYVAQDDVIAPDVYDGEPWYGAFMVRLAWACSSTFRSTDYLGGCDGSRIRFSPEIDWPTNVALDSALQLLEPIKDSFGDSLSWADLIAIAGATSLADAGDISVAVCGGRTDAPVYDGGSDYLQPKISGNIGESTLELGEYVSVMGLTPREFVALMGGHSLGQMHPDRSGFTGAWTAEPNKLDNSYFHNLLNLDWDRYDANADSQKKKSTDGDDELDSDTTQYRACVTGDDDKETCYYALRTDLLLKYDEHFSSIVAEYASDSDLWLADFVEAWEKLVSLDTFVIPDDTPCAVIDFSDANCD